MTKARALISILISILTICLYLSQSSKPPVPTKNILSATTAPASTSSSLGWPVLSPIALSVNEAYITKVTDGDTFQISTGQKVRMIGIDTPETVDPRRAVGCFGKEASDFAKTLLLNKKVTLVKDVSETDKYGRLLRYVYLDEIFVNKYLVEQGYAKVSSYPPDVKYIPEFRQAQELAMTGGKGLWKSCPLPTNKK